MFLKSKKAALKGCYSISEKGGSLAASSSSQRHAETRRNPVLHVQRSLEVTRLSSCVLHMQEFALQY
jgi:hypothetical protein